jgi:hypothetical protein
LGKGITIVQPDTGVAPHDELSDALDMKRALDVLTELYPDIRTGTLGVIFTRSSGHFQVV